MYLADPDSFVRRLQRGRGSPDPIARMQDLARTSPCERIRHWASDVIGMWAAPMGAGYGASSGIGGSVPTPPIAGMTLDIRSDFGITAAGGNVTQWLDNFTKTARFTAAGAARPALVAAQVNGKPIVRFNGIATEMIYSGVLADLVGAGGNRFVVIGIWKNNSAIPLTAAGYTEPAIITSAPGGYFYGLFGNLTQVGGGFYSGGDNTLRKLQILGSLIYTETILTAAAGGTLNFRVGTGGAPVAPAIATGAIGGDLPGGVYLGRNYNDVVHAQADLCQIVMATAITAPELAAFAVYANLVWGPGL